VLDAGQVHAALQPLKARGLAQLGQRDDFPVQDDRHPQALAKLLQAAHDFRKLMGLVVSIPRPDGDARRGLRRLDQNQPADAIQLRFVEQRGIAQIDILRRLDRRRQHRPHAGRIVAPRFG
jgi:hypothetical protein